MTPGIGQIELTKDAAQIAKLKKKLEEYGKRYGFMAPEGNPHGFLKYITLQSLVRDGSVSITELRNKYKSCPWFFEGHLHEAMTIVHAYNSGDMTPIRGGTGLR